ncbi:long-chain-fatty-acid--CoA ligase 6-like isoform X4 [Stegostoma tigrinum]|uniref:long-chain-fatty-acid--CoA ligase 6-like isoform X4 n=1 Tax=Stegostoma tigrinum TaxID=3053191 RepID=UPI00202B7525|nr:long-chain-fatty-acid--CoA ligase 6-like isoform X4 [Stegostoma tigrinum]
MDTVLFVCGCIWLLIKLFSSLIEKMQAKEILRNLQLLELDEFSQFFRTIPPPTLMGIASFAAIIAYWLTTRPKPLKPPCDLSMQSVEIEGTDQARGSVLGDSIQLMTHYHDDARTMYEVYQRGLHIAGDGPCLGFRKPKHPYQWLSYKEVATRAENLGSGLLQKNCRSSPDQFIGVFAQNRPEWIIAELACYTYSMVIVPLYDTLGPEAIRYIINTAEISTVICDKVEKAKVLLMNVEKNETPDLQIVILMDPFDVDLVQMGNNCGVQILALQEVENLGQMNRRTPVPPRPEDLSIVCFTSGTTGNPKGAMLTHGNVVADFSGFLKVTESQWLPTSADVHISYLPLAHMFERMVQSVVICHGGRIGFFQGDIRLLSDDMKALHPTIFPVVPRLLNRMYDKIFSQAGTPVRRWLLEFAARRKAIEVQNGIIRNNSLWDKLFFKKIQDSLGGKVRMIVTGAAPASPAVLGFLRAALGCQVYEGYGQTECTAGCTFTTPGDWTSGHVGAPLPCNYLKLINVDEMKYFSAKGEGENGTLKIIDRKKHIFKLAQGEYIAPEKIENIYVRSEPVAQVYVHGDSLQSFLVGIVVPDPEATEAWARKKGFEHSFAELTKSEAFKKAIMEDMVKLGQQAGLYSFEQVKAIYLHYEMFSVQNGLLTPTLKAKRSEMRNYFRKQIEELYANTSR